MKVYYKTGLHRRMYPSMPDNEPNILVLSHNDWNDYGSNMTLNAVLFINGEDLLSFQMKILIEDEPYTSVYLDGLIKEGWDGFFPVPNLKYVSVPGDVDLYSILVGKLGVDESIRVMLKICDAGYLKNVEDDKGITELIESKSFENSLLREGGARKAYHDGWSLFTQNESSSIDDFILNIKKRGGGSQPVSFKFNSTILPYDINVLIGENGIGKSHCLKSLVEYWLGVDSGSKDELDKTGHIPFDDTPNISRLILVSYSPFEEYTLDLSETKLLDKQAYKYFGFRKNVERDGELKIGISRNLPAKDSIYSLLKAYADDEKFNFMPNWIGKESVINDVLKAAIGYDTLALVFEGDVNLDNSFLPDCFVEINGVQNIIINSDNYDVLNNYDLLKHISFQKGVVFIKNNEYVELSSGQRLFCYIVVNVVGEIKPDSLVVIDEPELFLHPTLEVVFISLLKQILSAFNSKAILATHSITIAREIPSNCVHVFQNLEDGLNVTCPPFETFGGDMQRISTYVFGDNDSISKPFDKWIETKLHEYNDSESLIADLGTELNEEILIKILNTEVENGR